MLAPNHNSRGTHREELSLHLWLVARGSLLIGHEYDGGLAAEREHSGHQILQ